jgi:hypothetical protein
MFIVPPIVVWFFSVLFAQLHETNTVCSAAEMAFLAEF